MFRWESVHSNFRSVSYLSVIVEGVMNAVVESFGKTCSLKYELTIFSSFLASQQRGHK